jgi:hypothetical protein
MVRPQMISPRYSSWARNEWVVARTSAVVRALTRKVAAKISRIARLRRTRVRPRRNVVQDADQRAVRVGTRLCSVKRSATYGASEVIATPAMTIVRSPRVAHASRPRAISSVAAPVN